jgi:hypothetical protein
MLCDIIRRITKRSGVALRNVLLTDDYEATASLSEENRERPSKPSSLGMGSTKLPKRSSFCRPALNTSDTGCCLSASTNRPGSGSWGAICPLICRTLTA